MRSQRFDVPFGAGINQDIAKMVVEPPVLTVAQNIEFPKAGGCFKRTGHTSLAVPTKAGGVTVTSCQRLGQRKGALLTLDTQAIVQYSPALSSWQYSNRAAEGLFCTTSEGTVSVDLSMSDAGQPDCAAIGNIVCFTWLTYDGAVKQPWCKVIDLTNNAVLLFAPVPGSALGLCPRVVAIGTRFVIMWADNATNVKATWIETASPPIAFSGVTTTVSALTASAACAMSLYPFSSTQALFAFRYVTGGIVYGKIANNGGIVTSAQIAEDAFDLSICGALGQGIYMCWIANATSNARCQCFDDTTLASRFAAVTLDATNTNISPGINILDATRAVATWGNNPLPGANYFTKSANVSNLGAVVTRSVSINGVYPISRPFVYNGAVFVETTHASTLEATSFCLQLNLDNASNNAVVVATHRLNTAGFNLDILIGGAVANLGGGKFVVAQLIKLAQPTVLTQGKGAGYNVINFGDPQAAQMVEFGDSVYLSGGVPLVYDGAALVEAGFHYGPEPQVCSIANTVGGGSLSAGQYIYKILYEHTLDTGEVIYSQPCLMPAITAAANDRTTLGLQHIGLTRKGNVAAGGARTRIAVYRTAVNSAGPFFRLSATVVNSTTATALTTYIDGASDASIAANAAIYTDGNALSDLCFPSASTIAVHQDRLFIAQGKNIYYSKQYVPGEAARFNDQFVFRCEQDADIVALKGMDSALVVFKKTSIYVCNGVGFDDTGNGQNFSASRIASDVGCIEARSVVLYPLGLLFQSAAGIYQLSRSGNVTFLGAPVRDILATYPVITSAALHVAKNQVRFTCTTANGLTGTTIAYDYYRQQWVEHTVEAQAPIVSSVDIAGTYYYARSDGTVRQGNDAIWTDSGNGYSMVCETAWMKPTGLQGFYRARRVHYLGEYRSSHSITVQVAFNGDDIYTDARTWTNAELLVLPREQVAVHLTQQKCSSIKVRVQDTGTSGESYNMQGIAIEWIPKQGSTKISSGAVK